MAATAHDEDTKVLNTLIGTLIDSIEGYRKSAADVHNPRFASLFSARAEERERAVTTLRAAVTAAGGDATDDGTMAGAAHRAFVSLKAAVATRDDKAIVEEVERGEDYLKNKFETALRHADLSAQARLAVDEAWASVKSGHDEMSQLKHALSD